MNDIYRIDDCDITYLNEKLLNDKKELRILSSKEYFKIPKEHLQLFAHQNGIYSFPTLELAEWLKVHFDLSRAIEIGAGNGALARHLDIPATDSRLQESEEIGTLYKLIGQPVINYGSNIVRYEATEAIQYFRPETVIAQWVTHRYKAEEHDRGGNMYGVDEKFLIDNVKNYVFIGNTFTHKHKPILKYKHKSYRMPWLFSRSRYPNFNIIHIWRNKNYDFYRHTEGNLQAIREK